MQISKIKRDKNRKRNRSEKIKRERWVVPNRRPGARSTPITSNLQESALSALERGSLGFLHLEAPSQPLVLLPLHVLLLLPIILLLLTILLGPDLLLLLLPVLLLLTTFLQATTSGCRLGSLEGADPRRLSHDTEREMVRLLGRG